jgi:pimeloyl-ACP methyl ester carboxylesterase
MADNLWQDETCSLATGTIRYTRAGAGAPLLVLHHDVGNPGSLQLYDELARQFTVYIPDLPGFGGSERLEWARHPRDLALVLNLFLDELGIDRVTLLGLGFGGWLAAEMAIMNQRRVQRLVVVGAMGIRPKEGFILDQMLIGHKQYVEAGFSDPAGFERIFGAEPSKEVQQAWDYNREVIARIAWRPYMFSLQLPPLLRCLTVPTTVVWGRDDRVVPLECGEAYAQAIPNATLTVVDGAGHFVDMEQPAALTGLLLQAVMN